MLDEIDFIVRYDKEDMLGIVAGQPLQLKHEFKVGGLDNLGPISNMVLAGMGGSALEGEIVRSWMSGELLIPFEVIRQYDLPAYVGSNTLLIVSSYSGNTEEILSILTEGEEKGAKIVVLASGGRLEERAKEKNYPYFKVPVGLQPRAAVWYGVVALATLFESVGFAKGMLEELQSAIPLLESGAQDWKNLPTAENAAKQIAANLLGHIPIIYGGPVTGVAALKWKINFNETSKNLAFSYVLPEFDHNEFMGWSRSQENNFKVIELYSDLDHQKLQKRYEVGNRLLSGKMPTPIQVQADGETKLQQMLWTQLLGDFVSVYLGVLNGIDPTPVPMIEKLKRELV